ncbi:MAG: hypothetical protein H7282_05600, partial [Cytophagaceae bacterium]|nr:hypothetical protein [Cytophagaceae bacterium]
MIRFLFISFLLMTITCKAGDQIVLTEKTSYLKITGRMMDIYEDKEANKTFRQISRSTSTYLFHNNTFQEPLFYNT